MQTTENFFRGFSPASPCHGYGDERTGSPRPSSNCTRGPDTARHHDARIERHGNSEGAQGARHAALIPVIVVSALDDVDSVVKCIERGAEDYLFKPVNKIILTARIGACLEKKRLRDQEQAYIQHVKQELELGRQIQSDFLPAVLPDVSGWECAASFFPAYEVAGDFYDCFMLAENTLCLVIADVCGKGVGAALFMALVRSLMRAFSEQAPAGDPDAILKRRQIDKQLYCASPQTEEKLHVRHDVFRGFKHGKRGAAVYHGRSLPTAYHRFRRRNHHA